MSTVVEPKLQPRRLLRLLLRYPFVVASSMYERVLKRQARPPLYVFGFSRWKTFIRDWFPDNDVIFAPTKINSLEFFLYWRWLILRHPRAEVLTWQYNGPKPLKGFCLKYGISFSHVEDGFIRSLNLGALRVPPLSLAFDRQDMYFAAATPTDLEGILASYDFDADPDLMMRARSAISQMLDGGLSKYNSGASVNVETIYGPKTAKRVLVVGQVERDASIAYGCSKPFTNNDLVRLARLENPDADIIYKPHPEVLNGIAPVGSNLNEVRGLANILTQDVSLSDSFHTIDHVYTITSLSGFEALLRGIEVTTVGCPFYAGWGLTDDRQPNGRRTRKLSVEQIFAAAYILYPKYFDPSTKSYIEIEDALRLLLRMRSSAQRETCQFVK